jgi:CubicO group peptidase (beta-lactamase class C family)
MIAISSASAQSGTAAMDGIFAAWNSAVTPGCSVAVGRDGRKIFERAYGFADLEHDVPNRPDTIFEAGSVSKQFTAAAILILAQEGKLSLTDDIRKHVPEMPRYVHVVTIDHLLSHTSGLRDWGAVAEIGGWPRGTRAATNADALAIAARQKSLNYPPGTEYSYTNTGYNLMALIVERVSGSTLADFTRDRLFKPLGMASSSWRDDFRRIVKNRAVAYARQQDGYEQAMPFENAYGNGGLLTTTGDLLIWNEALANARLGAYVTTELHRRATLSYGRQIPYARGIVVGEYRGQAEIQHAGATGAYRAWLGRYPEEKLSVAILCNAGDAAAMEVGRRVAEQFIALQTEAGLAASPADLATRIGMFVNERTGVPILLAIDGERLRLKDGPPLDALAGDRFRSPGGEMAFEGADAFRLHGIDGETVRFRRVQPVKPKPAELAGVAGLYRSEEADAAYRVTADGDGLLLQHERRPETFIKAIPAYKDVFQTPAGIIRIYRSKSGKVTELGIGVPRVRDLRFRRS